MNIADWTLEEAIKERVQKEDWYQWAQKPDEPLVNNYKPSEFHLSETAKHVFGSAIEFISSIPKL